MFKLRDEQAIASKNMNIEKPMTMKRMSNNDVETRMRKYLGRGIGLNV